MTASTRGPESALHNGRSSRPRSASRGLVALAAVLLLPSAAAGDLVVLVNGEVFKVDRYQATEDEATLWLPQGGRLILPIERIERVLDDEIEPEPAAGLATALSDGLVLCFEPGQGEPETPFGDLIWEAARRHEVNPHLVAAMVATESDFNPRAVSRKGARGLMQLMPATAKRFGVRRSELFEPIKNLEAGVSYLSWLVERFAGNLPLILAAYNAGEAAVDRYGGVPPYRETRGYIRRIYLRLGISAALPGSP